MAKEKTKTNGKKIVIDMTGVEARKHIPEGDYRLKAVEATVEEGDTAPYIAWVFEVQDGKGKGGKLYDNTSLSPKALWRLRTLLEAMGIDCDGKLEVDLKAWVRDGGEFIGTVEHEEYEGKKRPRLVDVMPFDAEGDDSDDDGEEVKEEVEEKTSKKGKADKTDAKEASEKADADDGDEDGNDEAPDFDEMDEDELEEFIDEHDLDVDLDDHKKLSKKRAAVKAAFEAKSGDTDDGDDSDDGDDDEGEKVTEEAISEMGTKDLAGVVAKFKLGVALEGTTKAKRRAVLKALRAKDLLAA